MAVEEAAATAQQGRRCNMLSILLIVHMIIDTIVAPAAGASDGRK